MDPEVRAFLEQMAGMIAREFARMNARLDGIDARLDVIEARLEGHDRRLDSLETNVLELRREMRSEFGSVRQSIQLLTTRVEALEQSF